MVGQYKLNDRCLIVCAGNGKNDKHGGDRVSGCKEPFSGADETGDGNGQCCETDHW